MEIGISKIEYALGSATLTNDELRLEYPEWNFDHLETRTGVKSRPICSQNETALDFAISACNKLIDDGSLSVDEVDAVIFCTQTPDHLIPPNSCILHGILDLRPNTAAFDISHGCAGYPYSLMLARDMIFSGSASQVLVINSDTYSRLISPDDRATRSLFGDAGAVSLISTHNPSFVIHDIFLATAGDLYKRFFIDSGGARNPRQNDDEKRKGNAKQSNVSGYINMDGLGILTFFNSILPKAIFEFLEKNGLAMDDIVLVVPHQSSAVSLEGLRKSLNIDNSKFYVDIEDTGNLVSASIPIAFKRASQKHSFAPGDKILFCGFGVGLSWGLALVEAK